MKTLVKILLSLVLILILSIAALIIFRDPIIKSSLDKKLAKLTQGQSSVGEVKSSLSGIIAIDHFFIGKPPGFNKAIVIEGKELKIAYQPGSLLLDELVINRLEIESLSVHYELNANSTSNLNQVRQNILDYFTKEQKGFFNKNASFKHILIKKMQVDISHPTLKGQVYSLPFENVIMAAQGQETVSSLQDFFKTLDEQIRQIPEIQKAFH